MADTFRSHILNSNKADSQMMPVVTLGSSSFLYMREASTIASCCGNLRTLLGCPCHAGAYAVYNAPVQSNVYVLIVTRGNSNAAAGFKFITEVIALFKAYFNAFDEDALRNNFVLIYELLDGEHPIPRASLELFLRQVIVAEHCCRLKRVTVDGASAALTSRSPQR